MTAERPRKLFEIKRIAAALFIENAGLLTEELPSFERGQRGELDPDHRPRAIGPFDCGREALCHLVWAEGQDDEDARAGRPPEQRAEKLDGRRVGPVDVVEHENHRSRLRQLLEQRAHRSVTAVALVLKRDAVRCAESRE